MKIECNGCYKNIKFSSFFECRSECQWIKIFMYLILSTLDFYFQHNESNELGKISFRKYCWYFYSKICNKVTSLLFRYHRMTSFALACLHRMKYSVEILRKQHNIPLFRSINCIK